MEMTFIEWFKGNGPWAILFVSLFVCPQNYCQREERLMSALDTLAEKYNIIEVIRSDIAEIKSVVFKNRRKISHVGGN